MATRDRLRDLAKTMGYRPNPLISASMTQLRLGRRSTYAGTLAFTGIGPSPEESSADTQDRRIYLAARGRADALGYRLEYFSLDAPGVDGRRLSEILEARGIVGVVMAANCVLAARSYLNWSRFALAAVGRTDVGEALHRTTGDYYGAVREICRSCRARGYRRIGLAISAEHDTAHQGLHHSALLGSQARWPRREHVPALIAPDWSKGPFLTWVRRHRPEVVIASEDSPATWLKNAGIRVPEDIGLVRPHVNRRALGIGGFLFDEAALGSAAIDLIVEQLHHNERGVPITVKRVLLQGRWFEGRSLRPES